MKKDNAMNKARSRLVYVKGQKTFSKIKNALRKAWQAAKTYSVEQLRLAAAKAIQQRLIPGRRWPKHSLFCSGNCCQRPYVLYLCQLQKELVWSKDGHLV